MIELCLQSIQPLTVQIDGAHHILQEHFEPFQARVDKRNVVVDANSRALVGGDCRNIGFGATSTHREGFYRLGSAVVTINKG
jgi:hypothetical protein